MPDAKLEELTCDLPHKPPCLHRPPCDSLVYPIGPLIHASRYLQNMLSAAGRGIIHHSVVCADLVSLSPLLLIYPGTPTLLSLESGVCQCL